MQSIIMRMRTVCGKTSHCFDFANPSSQYTAITHRDRLEKRNDVLKEINVLKPDVIDKVVGEFNNFHKKVG